MVNFSLSEWLGGVRQQLIPNKARKVRRARTAHIEGLEDRSLLTANLPVAVADPSYTVNEDLTLNGTTVLANDTDADAGDVIDEAVLGTGPLHAASFTLNTNGTFTYTPVADFHGVDTFTYFARDSAHNENSATAATVTITVGSVNDAPMATPTGIVTNEDAAFSGTLAGTDVDGDSLSFAAGAVAATNGSVAINPDGSFTYTPNANFNGNDTFSFKVNDGVLDSTDALVTVVVNSLNDIPVANPITLSTAEDFAVSGNLTATDADGNPLTFTAGTTAAANGTVTLNSDGSFTYTPNANFNGTDTFSFKVNDGTVDSLEAVATINVTAAADVPVAVAANVSTNEDTAFTGTLTGTDADGDSLTFAAGATAPANGTVAINTNGSFTYTPNANFNGTDTFSFKVNDGTSNSADATVTVTVAAVNDAPVVTAATITTAEDNAFSGTLTATDVEGNPLTFAAGATAATNGTVTINPDGTFTFTPTANFNGTGSFSFRANDGTSNSADAIMTVTITAVADAPVANPQTITPTEDVVFNGTLTATDAEGDPLTFSAGSTAAAHGTVTINPNGTFTYTPNANFSGNDSFSFKANDGTSNSADATVTVNVTAVADAPVVANVNVTTNEDTVFNGTLTGTDAEGDALTFSAGAVAAAHGTVVINPNGTYSYTPNANFSGTDTFSYKANDGTSNSAEANVNVTITAVNDPPVATGANITVTEDTAFNGTLTATDAEGNPLTFSAGAVAAAHGTVTINPNGSFVYTPNANFSGTDSFTFKANDGTSNSAEGTINVTVTAVNDAPVANSVTLSTGLNTALLGTLTATDAEGNPLTFSAGAVAPAHGTLAINPNGTFTYTPTTGFNGTDTFSFKANDGTSNSAEATVTVNVGTANTAPTVIAGTGTTDENSAFNGSLSPLATDPEANPLTFIAVTQPTNGTLSLSGDGTFVYTPDDGFFGTDSFTFKANDGSFDSNVATFTITVNEVTAPFTLDVSGSPGTIALRKKDVTPFDPTIQLINVDPSVSFANASITGSIIAGGDRHDSFVITDGGSVDVRGKKIRFNGTEVARISGGKHGSDLQVNFNGSATQEAVTGVLQRIGLKTTKHASTSPRTVRLSVNADGFTSSADIQANV